MSEFNLDEYYKKKKELRELDVLISTSLFNKPCVKWWYTSNYDGDETVDSFDMIGAEVNLEPLYLDGRGIDRSRDLLDVEYYDGKYHKFDLEVIPRYSSDLNLIHKCEEKLKEMKLFEKYVDYLNGDQSLNVYDLVHLSLDFKAKVIIEVLKEHPHEN